jgi:serine/threonine-protein kinase
MKLLENDSKDHSAFRGDALSMKKIQVGDVVGDYTVIGIAGSGGMGVVYKIEHVITKRIEAMKLLPPGLSSDPEQARRFEREIQLQARLHHPNIVALYTAVRDSGSIALVMEYVEGKSLQRMVDGDPLPVETAVEFTIQVLRALAYAHKAGVIHRDVSPANIIITPGLVAKLTDFGLALGATDLRLSTSGVPLGSPWYMSPEQVTGNHELDGRTDLYAMGAVLHEMLTGRKLFEAEGAFAVMRAHLEAEPQLPSTVNPKLPPALDDIVRRAVAKDPAMRFLSADEFRLALLDFAIGARTVPEPSRRRKSWLATFQPLTSRLRGIRSLREALLLALVPTVLAAGFYAVRILPARTRGQVTESKLRAAAISKRDADRSSPAVTAAVEPQAPGGIAPTPAEVAAAPELPVAREESTATALPRVQPPPKARRRTSQTERSAAIRVSGGDSQPTVAMSMPRQDPPQAVEVPEPAVPQSNSVEGPEAGSTPTAAPTAELETTSQEAAPANPQGAGNRFVRALGKVNPFRRRVKHDAAISPLKQD